MDDIFLIYKIYRSDERPRSQRNVFYGWTDSKQMAKSFIKQREDNRYSYIKTFNEEIIDKLGEEFFSNLADDNKIDFILLKSKKTNESIYLMMTFNEKLEIERNIQDRFINLASFIEYDKCEKYLEMYVNLIDFYFDALEFIGFRPKELEQLFDSNEYEGLSSYEDYVSNQLEYEKDRNKKCNRPYGYNLMLDPCRLVLYSVESFIKEIIRNN